MTSSAPPISVTLDSAIYLAGDPIAATIGFASQNDQLEWAGVQIHGHVWHDARLVVGIVPPAPTNETNYPTPKRSPRTSSLSLSNNKSLLTSMPDFVNSGEGSKCIFATRPHCLAADVDLNGGPQIYTFSAILPSVLPPTYRGVAARYWYLLTVCVKSFHSSIPRVAHIPILISGTRDSLGDAARVGPPSSICTRNLPLNDQETADVINFDEINFYPKHENSGGPLYFSARESSSELVSTSSLSSTSRNGEFETYLFEQINEPTFVAINANSIGSGDRIAKCTICPETLLPGDALAIKIDFAKPHLCYKVEVALEQEERAICPPPLHAAFEPLTRKRHGAGPWIKMFDKTSYNVSLVSSCTLSLSTVHLTPDFSTELIAVRSMILLTVENVHGETSTLRYPIKVRPQRSDQVASTFEPRLVSRNASTDTLKVNSPPVTPKKLIFS